MMGTNYYAHAITDDGPTRLHVGKSSLGWCFALHVHPEHNINGLDDWRAVMGRPSTEIVDEYGDNHTPAEMLATITERSWPGQQSADLVAVLADYGIPKLRDDRWWADNHAVPGPNGLARHTHDAALPPNPATDTYDLCRGDFS